MKILLLAKDYPPAVGGVENYSYHVAEGLGQMHQVEVLTFRSGRSNLTTGKDSVKVTRIGCLSNSEAIKGLQLLFHLFLKLLFSTGCVVYATTWKVAAPAMLLKSIFRFPLILVCHGAEITRHRDSKAL